MDLKLQSFQRIVVLTGAGISAESGLTTFRDSNGLWDRHRVEDVATPEAFENNPLLVWRFYSLRRVNAAAARPNAAHVSLARFAKQRKLSDGHFFLVTQNVDGLHECAHQAEAAPFPVTMHGTLGISRCAKCDRQYSDDIAYFLENGQISRISTGLIAPASLPKITARTLSFTEEGLPLSPCCLSLLRPHIVWFGEIPLEMDLIQEELAQCNLFVTIGTSGNVYPAAGFLLAAKEAGARTVCLNKEPLPQQRWIDDSEFGPASVLVPKYFGFS